LKLMNKLSSKLSLALVLFSLTFNLMAQEGGGDGIDAVLQESFDDMYIVMGTGVGGAILGLSTLSFFDRPGDHLKNVWVGGALGVILGVGIITFKQATKSSDQLRSNFKSDKRNFDSIDERLAFDRESYEKRLSKELPAVGYQFSF